MANAPKSAAPKEEEGGAEKKKLPIVRILVFVLVAIALLGAGFGSALLYAKLTNPTEETPLAIVIEKKGDAEAKAAEAEAAAHAPKPGQPQKVKESDLKAKEGEKPAEGHGAPAAEGHGAPPAHGEAAPAGHEAPPNTKAVPENEKFVTSYYEFPTPFTTNLKNSRKFIQVGIGVATQYDATVMENVKKHELAIRSEILAVLAEQSEQDLSGAANRKRIQDLLRDGINKVLMEMEHFGGIENVFFTTMVMQ
jgi:flagellar FliL protein